ncbi:MAG: DUF6959 family protein [Gimesia chilikensis]|uniref:DUF6959 family protein n=1 Tax=Gimesia chilikensis TaxID=2605989 RepID=UPI0037B9874E
MYQADVEIYADTSNYAVMRHPGRNFPGALIQGDSLSILCKSADAVRRELDRGDLEEALGELEDLRELLWGRLEHYRAVLEDHQFQLPFNAGLEPDPPLEEYEDDDAE